MPLQRVTRLFTLKYSDLQFEKRGNKASVVEGLHWPEKGELSNADQLHVRPIDRVPLFPPPTTRHLLYFLHFLPE